MVHHLIELRAGSHLYGTDTPTSDTDLKAVHLPTARDILLQQARPVMTENRMRDRGERNQPGKRRTSQRLPTTTTGLRGTRGRPGTNRSG